MKAGNHFRRKWTGYPVIITWAVLLAIFSGLVYPNLAHASNLEGKIVVLDPGHGWLSTPGAVANGMIEKDVALEIANLAKAMLEGYGITVYMTRTGDEPLYDLDQAAVRANQYQPDLVVSIHLNAGGGTGTESCYQVNVPTSAESQRLGSLLTTNVAANLGLVIRGDFPENDGGRCARSNTTGWTQLYIHDMQAPAALIETAFIDGPAGDDVAKLQNNRASFAKAITDAVVEYFSAPGQVQSQNTATMLILDMSDSMNEPWNGGVKIDSARAAAHQVINMLQQEISLGGAMHRAGLVTFADDAYLNQALTDQFDLLRSTLDSASTMNRTNIGAALATAVQGLSQSTTGEKRIAILLSDGKITTGMDPASVLAGPVQDAVAAGICIYTVGFGDPGNLDEDLLRQIAENSGCGKYSYATDLNELMQVYVRIRHQSVGTLLQEFSGNISQSQTVQAGTVNVPANLNQFAISMLSQGSKIEMRLKDPAGQLITQNSPGVNWVQYADMLYAIIMSPRSGVWSIELYGSEVPTPSSPYSIMISARALTITPIPASLPSPPKPSESGSGMGIALILVALGGGGIALYIYSNLLKQKRFGRSASAGGSLQAGSTALRFTGGPLAGQSIHLAGKQITIGRSSYNQVNIPDLSVSRQHAEIRDQNGRWIIQDLQSKGGTSVNGIKVNMVAIHSGDQIQIGSSSMIFISHSSQ